MNGNPPPPPYQGDANRDPGQVPNNAELPGSPPAVHSPGQPINMQPMGQAPMQDPNQKVVPLHLMSERQEWVDCQMCKKRTRTRVEQKGQGLQIVTGALLCFVCICLTPLPCLLHWFEQTNWFCGECGKQIATQTPGSGIHVIPPPEALAQQSQYGTHPAPGQGPPPPHMNPQGPPTPGSAPMSPPAAAAGSPPPQGQYQQQYQPQYEQPMGSPPPQGQYQQAQYQQAPEIAHGPTPGQAPGGPESLPMKN